MNKGKAQQKHFETKDIRDLLNRCLLCIPCDEVTYGGNCVFDCRPVRDVWTDDGRRATAAVRRKRRSNIFCSKNYLNRFDHITYIYFAYSEDKSNIHNYSIRRIQNDQEGTFSLSIFFNIKSVFYLCLISIIISKSYFRALSCERVLFLRNLFYRK